jgi:hypothetical protein
MDFDEIFQDILELLDGDSAGSNISHDGVESIGGPR